MKEHVKTLDNASIINDYTLQNDALYNDNEINY